MQKKKHQINLYTFFWKSLAEMKVEGNVDRKIRYRKRIIEKVQSEINAPLINSNFKFKIHLHIIENEDYNIESIDKYLKKNNIDITCQFPKGFNLEDDKNYFDGAIHFDSNNAFNNATNGTHHHPNLFHTPSANSLINTYKEDAPELFTGKKLTKLMFIDHPEDSSSPKIQDYKEEAQQKNWAFKAIFEWQKNDFSNLKTAFKDLNENQIVLLDRTCWVDESGKGYSGPKYINGRRDVIKTFLETDSNGNICGFRLTPIKVKDIFKEVEQLKNEKVYVFVGDDYVEKLELQDMALSLDLNMSVGHQSALQWFLLRQLDKAWLIGYLYKNDDYKYTTREDFINDTRRRILMLNGVDDSFLKMGQLIYFNEDQFTPVNPNPLLEFSATSNGATVKFYSKQLIKNEKGLSPVNVNYKNFDFLTIDHVSIENNEFDISFILELTTPYEEGIEILKFHNVVKNSFNHTLLKKEELANDYYYYRYNVRGTFSFIPKVENYPFDKQIVYLSYSLVDSKYGLLEPIKNYNDDKIASDGWNIIGFRSGIIRRKEIYQPIFEKGYTLVSEEHRVGILISRPSSYTVTKVLVPLTFLGGLAIWGTYLPMDQIEPIIATTTTAFLSAIALYFSTEKPKPLSLTIIDLIFLLFYLFVGLTSIAIFTLGFFPDYYYQGLVYTRLVLGIFAASSVYYLYNRVKYFDSKMTIDD